jgi:hypothetical protein
VASDSPRGSGSADHTVGETEEESVAADPGQWTDKLEIRELIERSMRFADDAAGARIAELFTDDGVLQLAGTVFAGRLELREMFGHPDPPSWTEPGELLKQPAASHWSSNPIIDVDGDKATAETDMLVVKRDENGTARITLIARYRDRFSRTESGWLIANRTGVSIARHGEAGTDSEWVRALDRMPEHKRAKFRLD